MHLPMAAAPLEIFRADARRVQRRYSKLEVAYSADGGKSWETNWIMTDTLVGSP
jgi:hypothetical protein